MRPRFVDGPIVCGPGYFPSAAFVQPRDVYFLVFLLSLTRVSFVEDLV